ncbi:hypothetical protein EST38_g1932 [Candolleomyces aberdarensis]|uniref:Uncharacterized protein n=1 Tax=Candolleomyces aberdarensis TaxID=2316362 RepID=A0A4Q2DUK3_9AGAR|nr:hypothetical protein EST38_g1932 [Candolleomyces aberdarensis]
MITATDGQNLGHCVSANPDISGVGIRLSIYGQVFFNVAFALISPPDATRSHPEHVILAASSRSLFLTGCALLICAFYQGSVQRLTVHHTLIVLNLNWIIYFSALLHIFTRLCQVIFRSSRIHRTPPRRLPSLGGSPAPSMGSPTEPAADVENLRSVWQFLLLPAIHLSALGSLGILLWTQVQSFGDQPECTPHTVLTVFGSSYSVLDETIRRGSMAIYWVVAIPLLNVLVTGVPVFMAVAVMALALWTAKRVTRRRLLSWDVFVRCSGITALSMLLVLFISNTELMIARGVHTSLVGAGEEQWTFGQTLALISCLVQMVEMVKALYTWRVDRGGGRLRR